MIVIERCQVRKIMVQNNNLLAKRRQYDPEQNIFFLLMRRADEDRPAVRPNEGERATLPRGLWRVNSTLSKKQCTNCKPELILEVLESFQLLKSRQLLILCSWSSLLAVAEEGCSEFL